MKRFTPARRRLVSALPVLLLLAIGLTTAGALHHFLFLRERVWDSRTTFEAAEAVRRDLAEAQADNHQYLLTGGSADLAEYQAAAGQIERSLAVLAARTTGDPDLRSPANRLAAVARSEAAALERWARLRAGGQLSAADAATMTREHRAGEASAGEQIEKIERIIGERVRSDRAQERSAASAAFLILATGVVAGGLVVLLLRWILLGYAEAQAAAAAAQARARQEVDALLAAERAAEAALRESEERFRTLADNIPQFAWMADARGWIFWYNHRWHEYTGKTLAETEGWGWRAVHHPDHVERVVDRIQHSWDTGEVWEDTFPLRSRTGEYRWFLSRALPIRGAQGEVVRWFGTHTDITDQLQTEAALRLAKEEAEHANRAKSEFLAAMSHELRTPLNAVSGYVDLLEMGIHGPVTEAQLHALERIRVNGEHLLALINDILSYAKLEAGRITYELGELNVRETVAGLEPLIAPQIQKKALTYACRTCDPTWSVMGDRERVHQILLNLVANATKFTDAGGRIEISCAADEQRVFLHVSDTGHGIPADRLERIFEPFVQLERHRAESSQQGVGLGLAISRDLARGMDGELSVVSAPGAGSTFTLALPRAMHGVDARLAGGDRRRGGDRRDGGAEERRRPRPS